MVQVGFAVDCPSDTMQGPNASDQQQEQHCERPCKSDCNANAYHVSRPFEILMIATARAISKRQGNM